MIEDYASIYYKSTLYPKRYIKPPGADTSYLKGYELVLDIHCCDNEDYFGRMPYSNEWKQEKRWELGDPCFKICREGEDSEHLIYDNHPDMVELYYSCWNFYIDGSKNNIRCGTVKSNFPIGLNDKNPYGVVRVMARFPNAKKGIFPAIWTMDAHGSPENDIIEYNGKDFAVTHHTQYAYQKGYEWVSKWNRRKFKNPNGWHWFELESTPTQTIYRIDGIITRIAPPSHGDQRLILNSGITPDGINETYDMLLAMQVNGIEVWKKEVK